jgi:hypothetical protein
MQMEVLKIVKHESKLGGKGNFWYIFFKSELGLSYRTCVYEKFRNFRNWSKVIPNGVGLKLENLRVIGKLVDADSLPVIKEIK